MPSPIRTAPLSVEQLLEAVDRLPAPERREFQRRLAERLNGGPVDDEAALVQAATARLPTTDERRLRRLIGRSERGTLTARQLGDYQALAREAQRLDVARAEALAELARRRGLPIRDVQKQLGLAEAANGD